MTIPSLGGHIDEDNDIICDREGCTYKVLPLNNIFPEVGVIKPAINDNIVVLPQPEGPINDINSPLLHVNERLFKAFISSSLV